MRITLALIVFPLSGCASIVGGGSNQPVLVESQPSGADVEVTNRSGQSVYDGQTPAQFTAERGAGFFKKEIYTISLDGDGYKPVTHVIEPGINGWYWGNIVLGGVVGMLIVDPATGAMYRFDSSYRYNLVADDTRVSGSD